MLTILTYQLEQHFGIDGRKEKFIIFNESPSLIKYIYKWNINTFLLLKQYLKQLWSVEGLKKLSTKQVKLKEITWLSNFLEIVIIKVKIKKIFE